MLTAAAPWRAHYTPSAPIAFMLQSRSHTTLASHHHPCCCCSLAHAPAAAAAPPPPGGPSPDPWALNGMLDGTSSVACGLVAATSSAFGRSLVRMRSRDASDASPMLVCRGAGGCAGRWGAGGDGAVWRWGVEKGGGAGESGRSALRRLDWLCAAHA